MVHTGQIKFEGTSKNYRHSSDATKLPPTDSALFPFRFMDVHYWAVRDRRREQFFEVPLILFNLLDEIYDPSSELPVADLHEGFGQCHAFTLS